MSRGRRIRILAGLFAALAVWGFFDVRARTRFDERLPGRTDFTVYTEASKAFFDGRDPYEVTNANGWHYLYPPLFALLLRPLHGLPIDLQAYLWFLANVAMAFGCFLECRRIAATEGARPPLRWIAAAAAFALPALNALQRGQVGIAVLYPLLLGFRLVAERRSGARAFLGGVILALPVALKLTPALPVAAVGLLLLLDARRGSALFFASSSGVAAGLLLWFLLAPAAIVGWDANLRHLDAWRTKVVSNERLGADQNFHPRSVRNQSFGNALLRLGNLSLHLAGRAGDDRRIDDPARIGEPSAMDAPKAKAALFWARQALLLLCVAAVLRARRLAPAFGLACVATLLYSPISWGHHYTMLLPGALFCARSDRHAVALPILVLLHYASPPLFGRIGLLGLGTTAWWLLASFGPKDQVPAEG